MKVSEILGGLMGLWIVGLILVNYWGKITALLLGVLLFLTLVRLAFSENTPGPIRYVAGFFALIMLLSVFAKPMYPSNMPSDYYEDAPLTDGNGPFRID